VQIEILYQNSDFIVVNKPAGLITHAVVDKSRENLFDIIKEKFKGQYVGLLHRLDKDTSGALLLSLNPDVNLQLQQMLEGREIKKTYTAIVCGPWTPKTFTLEDFLKKERIKGIDKMVKVNAGGQKTITFINETTSLKDSTILSMTLETGRMHQLRVQTALRRHPVMGDEIYGDTGFDKKHQIQRLYLHASTLELAWKNENLKIEAPLPNEFTQWIRTHQLAD
jgi:RluA family pseudouridine synthase